MAEKNGFDITKLIFPNMCVWQCGAVVKELLASADERGSTLGDRIFCFCVSFFFLFILCFLVLFFLLACFSLFVLLTLLIMHLDQYIC